MFLRPHLARTIDESVVVKTENLELKKKKKKFIVFIIPPIYHTFLKISIVKNVYLLEKSFRHFNISNVDRTVSRVQKGN